MAEREGQGLFQLFITKRQKYLPREEIFHVLWKDADERVASRDFKVALNALNKVLEPKRTARSNPFFIQRHETAYGLHLVAGFELDSAEFEGLVHEGLEEKDRRGRRRKLQKGLRAATPEIIFLKDVMRIGVSRRSNAYRYCFYEGQSAWPK